MWSETIVRLLVLSLAGGIICGALWDVFLVPRIIFGIPESPKEKMSHILIAFMQDIVFCLACACVTLAVLYYGNEGNLRGIALVGECLGFFAYRVTLGALTVAWVKRICRFVSRIHRKAVAKFKKMREDKDPPEKEISKRNKIGKHQNRKVVGDKRVRKGAFYKSQPHPSRQREKSA